MLTYLSLYFSAYLVTQIQGKSNGYWIGFNDLNGDNAYDWIDNSPVTYTNWDQNAPRSQLQTKVSQIHSLRFDTRQKY